MRSAAAALALLPLLAPLARAASYPVVESHVGKTFLDGFNWPDSPYDNTTSGDVFWAGAANTSLVYVNDAGRVVMKVDTGNVPYNEKRYAPKILSRKAYGPGTVWVFDAVHLPYGCSVWPAFWTMGPQWPKGGEIDILEGIHNMPVNQYALHTSGDGCFSSESAAGVTFTGSFGQSNCSIESNSATGCTFKDKNENSYGQPFAAAGGGVYIAEFATEFVKIWFFSRKDVPAALTADAKTIDTGTLGTPVAWYPVATCDFTKFFGRQTLIIQTTLCGTWGSVPQMLDEYGCTLTGDNNCYTQYVINDAAGLNNPNQTYANAYFEINYVNVFSTDATPDAGVVSGPAASFGPPSTTDSAGSPSSAGASGSASSGAVSGTASGAATSGKANTARRNAAYGTGAVLVAIAAAAVL